MFGFGSPPRCITADFVRPLLFCREGAPIRQRLSAQRRSAGRLVICRKTNWRTCLDAHINARSHIVCASNSGWSCFRPAKTEGGNDCIRCACSKTLTTHNFYHSALSSKVRETPTGTWAELIVFRNKAQRLGYQSLATVALVAWEWPQR